MPKFYIILARKIIKIPEFCRLFARKIDEFYIIIAPKIFFSRILGGGGGTCPPPTPMQLSNSFAAMTVRTVAIVYVKLLSRVG